MGMKLGGVLVALLFTAPTVLAAAPAQKPPSNDDCLGCHEDPTAKRADGSSLFVDKKVFGDSVHGAAGASCVDCHTDLAKTTDFPHAEKLAKPDCSGCHAQEVEDYGKSWHAAARAKNPASKAAWCSDCHGAHDIKVSIDPSSRTYYFNVPTTCMRCHGDPKIFPRAGGVDGSEPVSFHDSIHGKALEKAGLKVAPNCTTCHGFHTILSPSDPKSPVARVHVPATCGSCHSKILTEYSSSIHGEQLAKGNESVPVCSDCHSAHAISGVSDARRLAILRQCGSCHDSELKSYRDTYHGQVSELGFAAVATCADCHTAHDIQPAGDPRSSVGPAKRLATCQKCHPGASAKFARYDPHANPHDRGRSGILWFTALFMKYLLVGVFAFFGVHTALWFPRSVKARREAGRRGGDGEAE